MSMQTPDLAATTARVANLERRIRWMMLAVLLLVSGAVAYAWVQHHDQILSKLVEQTAEPPSKSLDAEAFFVRGPDGTHLATLSNAKNGPILYLHKERGSMQMQVADSGAGLAIQDGNSTVRVRLAAQNDESTLQLFGSTGKGGAKVTVNKDGSSLALLDDNGKPRIRLAVTKEGPEIKLLDENGKAIASKP
jgi:hypothetical protein